MEIVITLVIVFALGLLFGALVEAVKWLGQNWAALKSRIPSDWLWLVDDLVTIGVKAAEQVYRGQKGQAAKKLEYAYNFVEAELKQYGLTFDRKAIETRIEAKVEQLYNSFRDASVEVEPMG